MPTSEPTAAATPAIESAVPPASVALITGANRGLGRHLALGLARAGVAVGLLGRSESALAEVAAEVAAVQPDAPTVAAPPPSAGTPPTAARRVAVATADVRGLAGVQRAVDRVTEALGPIDLAINNAGVIDAAEQPIWQADPEDWWQVVETDLRGPFHVIRAVVPGMVRRGRGRVVNLNSGAGASDRPIYSAYCAAKAGLFRLTGALHLAGYDRGLRAFDVSPGVVPTGMTASMPMHQDRTAWTPPEAVVDLVCAIAVGRLDEWSGGYLRAGVDSPSSLRAAAAAGALAGKAPRRLRIRPWGDGDPLPLD